MHWALTELLVFASFRSGAWNMLSYAALIAIIVGIASERNRAMLYTLGSAALAAYAAVFLHSIFWAVLNALVIVSGILQWIKAGRRITMAIMTILAILAYGFIWHVGAIADVWALFGSFGLLGLAFGLAVLPNRYGFLIMAAGGLLLIIYAFITAVWIIFVLNIIFVIVDIFTWRNTEVVKPAR